MNIKINIIKINIFNSNKQSRFWFCRKSVLATSTGNLYNSFWFFISLGTLNFLYSAIHPLFGYMKKHAILCFQNSFKLLHILNFDCWVLPLN